jgi:hypothetical protein
MDLGTIIFVVLALVAGGMASAVDVPAEGTHLSLLASVFRD